MSFTSLLDPKYNFDRYLELLPGSTYPENVLDEINLLSVDLDNPPMIYGSYNYRTQKYPGDIDLLQKIKGKSLNSVTKNFVREIKDIVRGIKKSSAKGTIDSTFFSEVKAGLDDRYTVDIGPCNYGNWIPNEDLLDITYGMTKKKLLTKKECDIVQTTCNSHHLPNQDFYDITKELFRNHAILRWSIGEILKGVKILPLNKKITLEKAVSIDSLVKIDVISEIDDKIVEITNNYYLSYGNTELQKSLPIGPSLLIEIEKMYYSNMFYNPFKCLKRMYAWARTNPQENKELIIILSKYIGSNTSQIYQIKSEISTILLLFEKYDRIPYGGIWNQIDNIKQRLARIIEFNNNEINEYVKLIDKYLKLTDYALEQNEEQLTNEQVKKIIKNKKELMEILETVEDKLKIKINYLTIEFFNYAEINPPSLIVPFEKRTYADVVRKPGDNPKHDIIDPLLKYFYD